MSVRASIMESIEPYIAPREIPVRRKLEVVWDRGALESRPHYSYETRIVPTGSFDLPVGEVAVYTAALLGLLVLVEMEKVREYQQLAVSMREPLEDEGPDYQAESPDPDSQRLLSRIAYINSDDHDVFVDYTEDPLGFS